MNKLVRHPKLTSVGIRALMVATAIEMLVRMEPCQQ